MVSGTEAPSHVLTVGDAARIAHVSERQMRRMCAAGVVRAARVGRHWRIPRAPFLRDLDGITRAWRDGRG